jgi:phage baseplate assembly protein W
MAIRDTTIKPYIQDRDENVFVGIDYPFHKSSGVEGWFKSTSTTIEAVKNNINILLRTERGERLMQPNLGVALKRFLFQQIDSDTIMAIQNEIIDSINFWLPFVEIKDIKVSTDDNRNIININITFNIIRDPNTLSSVEVEIGE